MFRRNSLAVRLMLGTILLSRLAAARKPRLATQRACLQFRRRSSIRSNIPQLRAVNTLPPKRKGPSGELRAPGSQQLDEIQVEVGYRLRGSNCLTTANWSSGLPLERCWRAWALLFPLAQTPHSGRTAEQIGRAS